MGLDNGMRILILTDSYYPSRTACAVRMKVMVERLRELGDEVHVLASDTSLEGKTGYVAPDYVHFFPVVVMGKKTVINRLKNNLSGSRGAVKAAKRLGAFDIVIVSSPPLLMASAAMRIAHMKNAKLVFDVRDIWPDVGYEIGSFTENSIYGRVFACIAAKAYKEADLITTVSDGKARRIKELVSGSDADKVQIVANGLDLDFLSQECDSLTIERFHLDHGPLCVYVGNIGLAQGLETVFLLAKYRPDVRFLLFGDGASREKLEKEAYSLHLSNVLFCGQLDSKGVYTVLQNADLSYVPLVNSNLSDSIPTKMFEAIGCGCPVLLAAAGDSVQVLNDIGLGVSAAPEDIAGLKKGIDRLISAPYKADDRSNAAKYVAEKYSRQAEIERLSMLIHRL